MKTATCVWGSLVALVAIVAVLGDASPGRACADMPGSCDGADESLAAAPIDLLSGGGMESDGDGDGVPDGWLGFGLSGDARKCDRPAQTFAHAGSCAFRFVGEASGGTDELRQGVTGIAGDAGDTLTLRVWARATDIPAAATARIRVQLRSAGVLVRTYALKLGHGSYAYQRLRKIITAPSAYDDVRVRVEYDGASGQLVVDDVTLTRLIIDPGPGPTAQCTVTPDANGFFSLDSALSSYWVRLPAGYDVAHPQPTRLVVGLHGCGDTAQNFASWAVVPFELRTSQDYIALSLGGRDGACWNLASDGAKVAAAIAHVRTCFWVHQKKIVIAGYSSGGDLAYDVGLTNAATYAGILVENASLSSAVGAGNVASVLDAVAWPINVALTARVGDMVYPIAGVHADHDALLAAGLPLVYRELPGEHGDTGTDWSGFLLPAMVNWVAP